ncbi:MAG TPA: hypothetical protein VF715_08085 [Thermoleophilaceae bacterium]
MAFRNRAAEKARQAAAGGDGPPAGRDPQVPGEPVQASTADRGAIRKRLRAARRRRDVALHELGALVMEMHRQGRHDPALVERKARETIAVDSEARTLAGALDGDEPIGSLRAAGVAGPCGSCGNLLVRDDRFCNRCGAAAGSLTPAPVRSAPAQPAPVGAPVLAAPPPSGAPVEPSAPPPSGAPVEPSAPPPPSAAERVEAPPPSAGDRVEEPASGDGIPTYTVTTR